MPARILLALCAWLCTATASLAVDSEGADLTGVQALVGTRQPTQTPTPTPTPTRRHGFYLMGQSNMSGYGLLPGVPDATSSRMYLFGNDYLWHVSPIEPMDCDLASRCDYACGTPLCSDQVDAVSDDILPRFGPSQTLGVTWLDTNSGDAAMIPCALVGSPIAAWQPGADRLDRTTLYGSCNYRRTQVEALVSPECLVFFQGESETFTFADADQWGENFTTLVSEWRADWGTDAPVAFVRIGDQDATPCPAPAPTPCPTAHPFRYYKLVQQEQEAISLYRVAMVDTTDLGTVDGPQYHFSTADQRIIGARMANACETAAAEATYTPTPGPTSTPTNTPRPGCCDCGSLEQCVEPVDEVCGGSPPLSRVFGGCTFTVNASCVP